MKFTLVKNTSLSGSRTTIYSVLVGEQTETLLERFVSENIGDHREEVRELLLRLQEIGHTTGCRDGYFKEKEGRPGDGIEALYDDEKHLRLYCIRNGRVALIMGGGGPKQGGSWQDYPKLAAENKLLQLISITIIKALSDPYIDLKWSDNGMELLGNLTLDTDEI